jgi:L-ribulose-5-phosphate 3-epimerase
MGTSTISFMSANYVARQLGYRMTGGWDQGDRATNDHFCPLETFAERFEELLLDIRALDFESLDLWSAHLNGAWATPEHLTIASELLTRHGLRVTSFAGRLGESREEFERTCDVAEAVGTTLLGGSTPLLTHDRSFVLSLLSERGLRLAIENHPERAPEEMLDQIGARADGLVGTTVDTGWYATHDCDPVRAIEQLAGHVFHVHLKDIRAAGAHETCRYGEGVVPIEECLRALERIGYEGSYSVEHEPALSDPTEDCRAMQAMLEAWLERIR